MGALLAHPAGAIDLKVRPWPMSDRAYDSIDVQSVRAEIYMPETAWLEQVGGKNGRLSLDLNLLPVASIDIYRLYNEEEITNTVQLLEEARKTAAKFGANMIFLERRLMQGRELDGLRFTAYRAEYKHRLLSPTFLAALPHMTVAPSLLNEQLLAWNMSHFGTTKVAVANLGTLKTGTAVRVVMRDGSAVKGAFNGIDADNQIWIHPAGWTGLFRDKAISPTNVQSVSLLN
jgi:hypothetical protein